ncbi:MAG: barstar family protein [Eubacteriales bacterium]|nr:barstar family protein [Eubacteriales bacterium]
MLRVELDGRKMDTRAIAHQHLKEQLGLPAYYGANLDALNDCLGEMADVHITLRYGNALRNALGVYGQKLIQVFEDVARGRADLVFVLMD